MKVSPQETQDIFWMNRALALARKGEGRTSPNPMVGAILVHQGKAIATGYHHYVGGDHAEVDCLKKMNFKAPKGSVLYVTLEPCCHHGRTPPCTDAIVKSGVKTVVVAGLDPNPQVAGQGSALLNRHGISIRQGICEEAARQLNRYYYHWRMHGRPYVVLKTAMTIDGKVGMKTGESKWITGIEARTETHRLRRDIDAVVVGVGTVAADDPELTVRHVPSRGRDPIKIVIDPSLRLSSNAKLLKQKNVILATSLQASRTKKAAVLGEQGVEIVAVPAHPQGGLSVQKLLRILGKKGMLSILVEGGPRTYSAFLKTRLVDEWVIFMAPKLIGDTGMPMCGNWGSKSLRHALQWERVKVKEVGDDLMMVFRPR